MERQLVSIQTEFIKLDALLKLANLVGSGERPKSSFRTARFQSMAMSVPCGEKNSGQGIWCPFRAGRFWSNEDLFCFFGRFSQL